MKQERHQFEEAIAAVIRSSRRKKKAMDAVKRDLGTHHTILPGEIQRTLDDPAYLREMDIRKLILLGETLTHHTNDHRVDVRNFFTDVEIKKAKQYQATQERKTEATLPFTLQHVFRIDQDTYLTYIEAKTIKTWMDARLIEYNYDVQREAVFTKRNGVLRKRPKLNQTNIQEIRTHLLNGTLEHTQLVLNAAIRTGDDGEELVYDPDALTLEIQPGTRLDSVDGYHRVKATALALMDVPDLSFRYSLLLTNYSDERARNFQAQFSKMTPLSKSRQQELEGSRHSDTVVAELKTNSELKGKIAQGVRVQRGWGEVVSYSQLAGWIDTHFPLRTKRDAHDVADFLTSFFDYLIGYYEDEFHDDRKVMGYGILFPSYLKLARRMYDQGVPAKKIVSFMKPIDFSRDHPWWEEIGVVDETKAISQRFKQKNISTVFDHLSFEEEPSHVGP